MRIKPKQNPDCRPGSKRLNNVLRYTLSDGRVVDKRETLRVNDINGVARTLKKLRISKVEVYVVCEGGRRGGGVTNYFPVGAKNNKLNVFDGCRYTIAFRLQLAPL